MDDSNKSLLLNSFIENEKQKQRDKPTFQGIPEEWLDASKWCCYNGHVNDMYIKSEMHGPRCLTCGCHVRLFPTGVTIEYFHQKINL